MAWRHGKDWLEIDGQWYFFMWNRQTTCLSPFRTEFTVVIIYRPKKKIYIFSIFLGGFFWHTKKSNAPNKKKVSNIKYKILNYLCILVFFLASNAISPVPKIFLVFGIRQDSIVWRSWCDPASPGQFSTVYRDDPSCPISHFCGLKKNAPF